jgi:hypothetical protein
MSRVILEVEAEYQPMVDAFAELLKKVREQRAAMADGKAVKYEQTEQEVAQGTAAVERAAHAVLLSALDIDAPQVVVGGQAHRRVLRTIGSYYTMAGPVSLMRTLYRPVGQRHAPTVDTISLRAGVVGDGWLPVTAATMAWECQRAPSREAEAASERWQRLPYSRCAFERVAHLVGEHYGQKREEIERMLVETMPIPDGAHALSVSMDRVSIPMEEPREEAQKRPENETERSPKRKAPKRYVQRVFRMAYAATVTLHDANGKALHTLRYGRMPQGDIDGLCTALCDDVLALLRRCPNLLVVLLCDGAKELWNRLGAEFTDASIGRPVHRLVDLWHLLEKLGSAAKLLYGDEEGSKVLTKWRLMLLNEADAVEQILGALKASGKESARSGDSRPVHEAITYLENHRDDMRYKNARDLALPVGSGNVEATCKSLFEVRLKRPGCRWKTDSGAHIVDLRALALSDRFPQALSHALAPLRTAVSIPAHPTAKLSCAA